MKLTFAIVFVAAVIVGYAYQSIDKPLGEIWYAASWRGQVYWRKGTGQLPELSWSDVARMTTRQGGFHLGNIVAEGESPFAAISNPYNSTADREAGSRLFNERCARCHGAEAKGDVGPQLRSGLKHGDSDLAVYEVLRDGIPGTAMMAPDLSFQQRWQIIGYLRSLQFRSEDQQPALNIQVSGHQINKADSGADNWLTYSGSLNGWRFSSLSEITPANVAQLRLRWIHQSTSTEPKFEATPLVIGNTMFVTEPPATVLALNAKTGEVIWTYQRPIRTEVQVCCGVQNRGLSVLGNMLFFASLDGYLVAIDTDTGNVKWQTQVVNANGYSLSGAPLIVNNAVVIGVAGAEYGIRGFLAAYDAATGEQRWRFNTVPGPDEAGHETWQSDAWKTGGGSTWVTGSYDPALDLLYWGVGNPAPPFTGNGRPGDNLYTDSVIALHASTGKLVWHFQFTPHDEHDWDSSQTPILADLMIDGVKRKAICWPNRNGFYYVLDRVTGEFLKGAPFVELNWASGLTPQGKPILATTNSGTGAITKPGYQGATVWQPAAFNPTLGLVYINAIEASSVFTKSAQAKAGEHGYFVGSAGSVITPIRTVARALDAATGAMRWEWHAPVTSALYVTGGMLTTAGGLTFGTAGGSLFALDAATGKELWTVNLGGMTVAPPISFALDGRQAIAVFAGRSLFVFAL